MIEIFLLFSELLVNKNKYKILYLLENEEECSEYEICQKMKISKKECKKALTFLEKGKYINLSYRNEVTAKNFPYGKIIWYYSISAKGIDTLQRIKKIKIVILLFCLLGIGWIFLKFI